MRPLGWALIQSDWCPNKKRKFGHTKRHEGSACTEEGSCEDMVRGRPPASQGERPQKKPNQLTP